MSGVKPNGLAAWSRPLLAELMGTALLVTVVVGSGIAAARLSPADGGLQLLENSTATAFGLAVLILVFGPVSGGHFNPMISAVDWLLNRQRGNGVRAARVASYAAAQLVGAILGALLANIMFDLPAVQISGKDRISLGHGLGELVATAGLVLLVFALAQTGRAALSAAAVGRSASNGARGRGRRREGPSSRRKPGPIHPRDVLINEQPYLANDGSRLSPG